jgi:hypothetical protein
MSDEEECDCGKEHEPDKMPIANNHSEIYLEYTSRMTAEGMGTFTADSFVVKIISADEGVNELMALAKKNLEEMKRDARGKN